MRKMGIGLGVGINRSNYAQGIFSAYQSRVIADGGVSEAGGCVDAVSSLLQSASLLLIPSGYKGGKVYSEIPTNGNGDLTWTRASDAWRTNADGLIQRVPWNLLQRSQEFDNAIWTKYSVTIVANDVIAPDGTLTADTITFTGNIFSSAIRQNVTVTVGATYTFSIYAKTPSGTGTLSIDIGDGTNVTQVINSTWNRYTFTLVAGSLSFVDISSTTASTYNLWGAQLVEGSSAQTYFPTTDRLNVPRLSYMYGSCPALLLEPQRTNLALYSEDFSNASWAKIASASGTITATDNYNTSPDGNTNATRLVINNLGSAYASQSFTCVNGLSYTISIYAKSNTSNSYTFQLRDGYSGSVSSNLTITPTWQRFTFTFTASGTTAEIQFRTTVLGSYDLSVYGAQGELGAYPTTYIPTTSASATRVADSFSRNNIYTNGLITSSGGTWFVELRNNVAYTRDASGGGLYISSVDVGGGGTANTLGINLPTSSSARPSIYKRVSNSYSTIYDLTVNTTKIAIKWNGSTADVFVNGTKVVSATSFTATVMEFLSCGAADIPKFIQSMALYPSPLSDTDCITLTT